MKVLVIASSLDLRFRLGCTPSWWQLLKALHETGHEVVATSYMGHPVESPWWRTVPNPCAAESLLAFHGSNVVGRLRTGRQATDRPASMLARRYVAPRWKAQLRKVASQERDLGAVLLLNVPINQMTGVPEEVRDELGLPTLYYDGDLPAILPEHALRRGFRFSYYEGADLSVFDRFFSNSKGALPRLRELGARDPQTLYYAADPDLLSPAPVQPTADVAFYGHGAQLREDWVDRMVCKPSRTLATKSFVVGGGGLGDTGRASDVGHVSFGSFGRFVGAARINLNITRSSHSTVHASATARPFELAALGAAVVSNPYAGLREWFSKHEMIELGPEDDPAEVYTGLLDDDEARRRLGERARQAILGRHTWKHRARELLHGL